MKSRTAHRLPAVVFRLAVVASVGLSFFLQGLGSVEAIQVPSTLADRRPVEAGPVEPGFAIDYLGVVWSHPDLGLEAELHVGSTEPHGAVRFRHSGTWGSWIPLEPEGAQAFGSWGSGLVSGDGAEAYQVRGIPAHAGDGRVVALNTSNGPLTTVGWRTAGAAEALSNCVSRQEWGADESIRFNEGVEVWPAEFAPVQTITVHHTVTLNGDPDPAAAVRAIYEFHAIDRGWGDIGYHLLIDEQGQIYEGRWSGETSQPCSLGGQGIDFGHHVDDQLVTGGHVGGFNTGNIGVALLGEFTDTDPARAAVNALQYTLTELVVRHGLDPLGTVDYFNPVNDNQTTVDTISGHRDWNATECPGELLYPQLPQIRGIVTSLMGSLLVGVDTTLTEDHQGNIVITADDLTLDCDSHSLIGGGEVNGILLDGRTNVTIQNCNVGGFQTAIHISTGSGNTLTGNTIHDNSQAGISLRDSNDNLIADNTLMSNGTDHATFGVLLVGSDNNTVAGNTATDSGETAFAVELGSDGNTISGNRAYGGQRGFTVTSSRNNLLDGNAAVGVSVHGFESDVSVLGTVLRRNLAEATGATGFGWHANTGTSLIDNASHGNGAVGFEDRAPGGGGGGNGYSGNVCVANALGSSSPLGLCQGEGTFTDDNGRTFETDIEWMKWMGITLGCDAEGTLYCPRDSVTRAQMASFLVRALDLPPVAGNRFTDVSGIHAANINALAEAGVTLGCDEDGNLYCPSDEVTREQMASFLVRALKLPPVPGAGFADVSGIHEPNINAIAQAGITLGCNPDGTLYCPKDFVTRGQMAGFLHRALG